MIKKTTLLLFTIFNSILAGQQVQSQIYLNSTPTGANNGTSLTDTFANLQPVIIVAGSGNEIWEALDTNNLIKLKFKLNIM